MALTGGVQFVKDASVACGKSLFGTESTWKNEPEKLAFVLDSSGGGSGTHAAESLPGRQ